MKKILFTFTAILYTAIVTYGQNLFFIGENSYPATETITLQSNYNGEDDFNVLVAKDGKQGILGVSTGPTFSNQTFSKKVIIYLEDATVITCTDRIASENVDQNAKAAFFLNSDQLGKMKNSNIHTVRYTIEILSDDGRILDQTNWSASNKGIDTKSIITDFFENRIKTSADKSVEGVRIVPVEAERKAREEAERKQREEEQRKINEVNSRTAGAFANSGYASGGTGTGDSKSQGVTFPGGNQGVPAGDPNANKYGPGGSGSGNQESGSSYSLSGRSALYVPKPSYPGYDAGIVVVKITVNNKGKVTSAEPGVQGTTVMNKKFWNEAKEAALRAKFNVDKNAPKLQQGTISYRFVLD